MSCRRGPSRWPAALFALCHLSLLAPERARPADPVDARPAGPRRVLLLNSYHPGYQWTDDETRGVLSVLGGSPKDVQVYIEYMGTKWASDPAYFQQLRQAYASKFQKLRFDVIVATDDDALRFLLEHREAIFGRVPTVFCGVNNFHPAQLHGHELYTGVNEVADFRGGLALALRLHPGTRRIAVINDSSISGRKIREQFEEVVPEFAGRLEFEFLGETTLEEVLARVARLPPDALVFHLVYFSDATGRILNNDETAALVSRASPVPVYGAWEFSLGHGIVGGKLLTGFDQGAAAAGMARRILTGTRLEELAVVMSSPSRYMFDDEQLRRFGIDRSRLPRDSVVIHAPPSFYALNKVLVWSVAGGLAGLLGIVALLLVSRARRQLAEEALRAVNIELAAAHVHTVRSRDNLRRLLECIPDVVILMRLDGSVAFVNGAGRRMLGAPGPAEVVLPPDHPLLLSGMAAATAGAGPDTATVQIPSERGPRECEVTGLRVDVEDQPAVVVVARDFTDRRDLDRRLALADRMASVGTLAAGVAHEINNPLSYILSNLRFLSGELVGIRPGETERLAEARKVADETLEGAERVRRIVLDLNAFARPGEGRGPVDLHRVLDLAVNVAACQIRFRARLVKDYAEIPRVQGDESRLGQVVLNLLVNAAQAIPEGLHPDENEIRIVTRSDPARGVLLEVHDTGCGIPPERLSRVFEPFYTTKPVGAGTGLGLSTSHAIVTGLGGEITVQSEVGRGTVFRLVLPAAADPRPTPPPAASAA